MTTSRTTAVLVALLKPLCALAIVAAIGYLVIRWNLPRYPYGPSHYCDKGLAIALHQYADEHGGWFPRGEETPEASFSLLYKQTPELGPALGGKAIPAATSLALLENGQPLTAETCSWHYVEGLRSDDPPQLALFWDETGLGHNGEELRNKGHFVGRVDCSIEFIPDLQWDEFLAEQETLRRSLPARDSGEK
jgi:hypothetical protein